jgi:hypothetical protein
MADDAPARPRSAFAARAEPKVEEVLVAPASSSPFTKEYWTKERRDEQRAKIMAQMAAGTMGRQNGHGRQKTKKVQEIVAEHAREQAALINERLDGMLNQTRDKRIQLEAIDRMFRAEEWSTKNSREEERHYKDMGDGELDAHLLDVLADALGMDLGEIVDATVVEDADPEAMMLAAMADIEAEEGDADGDD